MTQSQELARRTDGVVALIQDPRFLEQLQESLPENVDLARFKRVAITTIREKPELLECNENSLFAAIVRCAQDGLLPDGKEAAIVKRGQGDKARASYMPMVTGIRKKAAEHGWTIYTAVVYEHDSFSEAVVDGEKQIRHEPVRPGMDRGELVAVYAIARHRDGRRVQTVLHPADVAERRELAQTKNVWDQWKPQMWEKSAAHDVFGQLGLAENDRAAASMLSALAVDGSTAKELLYGGSSAGTSALPAGTNGATEPSQRAAGPPDAELGAGTQQAATAGTLGSHPQAAAAAPEPDEDAAIAAAAREAAQLVPPEGVHAAAGRTLAGIHALGEDGTRWFAMAMRKGGLPDAFRTALFNYARVYLPDLFDQVIAEQEAQL